MKTHIVPHKFYRDGSGRTYSLFTSWKPDDAVLVTEGFTTANEDGTYGCGKVPFKTEAEGNEWLAKFPRFKGMHGMGN